MRTNREQDIEQVAAIISDYIMQARAWSEEEDLDIYARTVNGSTGWTYDVRYETHHRPW